MTYQKFESTIAYHCAPVLMGIKPSNLVSFSKKDAPQLPEILREYEGALVERGIHTEILCGCRSHYLVLVFRPDLLDRYLGGTEISEYLVQSGYRSEWTLMQKIRHLSRRFERGRGVPHEIGAFLGYPIEDILGFCENQGEGCKLCGYWKVYGDVRSARQTFAAYDRSREIMTGMMTLGMGMLQALDQGRREWENAA